MSTPLFPSCIRKLLLGANLAAPLALIATRFQNLWILAAAFIAHGCFVYAITSPQCRWLGPVITRFSPRGDELWLTIDDGPYGAVTEQLSEEMRRRNVRATFFIKGCHLLAHPESAAQLLKAGHTLANHTQTHPAGRFWWLWPAALRREIDGCNAALAAAGVAVQRWFRAPVGLKHTRLHRLLAERGMRLIAWSIRGGDGVTCDPEAVARRVVARAFPGAIVLLHEGRPRSVEAILRVVDELHARGYSFVIPEDEQLA